MTSYNPVSTFDIYSLIRDRGKDLIRRNDVVYAVIRMTTLIGHKRVQADFYGMEIQHHGQYECEGADAQMVKINDIIAHLTRGSGVEAGSVGPLSIPMGESDTVSEDAVMRVVQLADAALYPGEIPSVQLIIL
jgi:hypothetical protein